MNETVYVYIVHSDIDENNIYAEFATEEEAIEYARRNKDDLTYVDRVEVALDEEGDIIEEFGSETIWVYDEEDEGSVEEETDYWNQFDREDEESWFEDLDTDQLVETLEENEDIVECKECFELFPKEACTKIAIGYICPECGKIHSHEESEFEVDSIPDVVVADDDFFKVDFPELERVDYGNDMIPDEPTPEVRPNPEPCVGPECEAPVETPVTKDETITKLVVDEHEAIDGYEKAKIEIEANSELDEKEKKDILDTIEHIKEEEIEHIEELEELVDEVEETRVDEPAKESEDESKVLVEEATDTVIEEPEEEVPTEEVADEEKDLDAELAKKMKQLKIAKVDTKIAKQQAKQAKHLKTATKQTNTAAKDSAKTNLTVNKKNNAVTKDTAKTDLAVTKAINDIEVDNSKAKVAVSKDDVKVAKNTLKTTKLNNKIRAITPEEETEEIIPTEVEQPIETAKVETIDEALLEGFLTDILADAGAGAGIGAIGGTAGAVVGAGAGAVFAIVKNISKSIGDSFKKFKDASDVKKALKRDPQLNDTIEKLVAETGEDNAEKILQWIEDYYTRKVFDEKPTDDSDLEIIELDIVDDFEDEFDNVIEDDESLEEPLMEYFFDDEDPKNWSDKEPIIYEVFYKEKLVGYLQFNYRGEGEEPEQAEITKALINLYDDLVDSEVIPEDSSIEDLTYAYDYTDWDDTLPVIEESLNEAFQDKVLVEGSGFLGKIILDDYFKKDGQRNPENKNGTGYWVDLIDPDTKESIIKPEDKKTVQKLKEAETIATHLSRAEEGWAVIRVEGAQGWNGILEVYEKGKRTQDITQKKLANLNKAWDEQEATKKARKALDKSLGKDKPKDAETIDLPGNNEQQPNETQNTNNVNNNDQENQVEAKVIPTQVQLRSAYRLLVALLGTRAKAAEYITVEGKGINAKYSLVQSRTFDEVSNKIKELQKAVLGEALTEHVNEEHPAIESDQKLVGIDNAVVDCKVNKVITHSEDEKPVDCEGKKKPLEKPLTESSLVKGNYEISPTEHLSWGWDKGDSFYVEKNYRPSENEQIWNTEFRRTYATAEDAEKAFKRYVKKYSVLTEDALDWELEKVEIKEDSLEETDIDVKGECTVHGNLETFDNTKERTEDDARFDYDKKEDEAEVKGLSSDFTDSDVDKIERIVARDIRLNLKKNTK